MFRIMVFIPFISVFFLVLLVSLVFLARLARLVRLAYLGFFILHSSLFTFSWFRKLTPFFFHLR